MRRRVAALVLACAVAAGATACGGDGIGVQVRKAVPFAEGPAPDGGEQLLLDLYRPPTRVPGPHPAMVWLHGGGFVTGHRSSMRPYAEAFARKGWVAVTIDYRLAEPNGQDWFPAFTLTDPDLRAAATVAREDGQRAVRWLRARAAELGIDPQRIAVGGYSAGAIAALEVAYHPDPTAAVTGVIAIAGGALDPAAIPAGVPPALLFHGLLDEVVSLGVADATCQGARFVAAVCEMVIYPERGHEIAETERDAIVLASIRFLEDGSLPSPPP